MKIKEIVLRFIFKSSVLFPLYVKRHLKKNSDHVIWGGGVLKEEIDINIEKFIPKEENIDLAEVKQDIVGCYLKYGTTPQEYFLFGFLQTKNSKLRSTFLSNKYKDQRLIKRVGMDAYLRDLRDKYNFYLKFKPYFKRTVLKVSARSDFESFRTFVLAHPVYFIKPFDGMCGRGAEKRQCDTSEQAIIDQFNELISTNSTWLVEEFIQQHESMSRWNVSSVNTVRIPSFLTANGLRILKPFLRTGRKGFHVDNAVSLGVFAILDEKTGEVLTDGYDELGNSYRVHPDSQLPFKGWNVPHWNELIDLVGQLHTSMPQHPYIGWDFALTDEGWVLIEGDWGQFISEFADREGIKEKFDKYLS